MHMVKFLVLDGHPLTPSFSQAISVRYAEALREQEAEVQVIHLSSIAVPDLNVRKPGETEMVGDVLRFWEALVWADQIVIVHPLWWGGMPAKLKALFDIALQPGRAFKYRNNNPLPLGLLKGRSARLIVTSDTPGWYMRLAYGNAHFRAVKRQILKFVGLSPVRSTHLFVMHGSSFEQRKSMLEKVERLARRDARR